MQEEIRKSNEHTECMSVRGKLVFWCVFNHGLNNVEMKNRTQKDRGVSTYTAVGQYSF